VLAIESQSADVAGQDRDSDVITVATAASPAARACRLVNIFRHPYSVMGIKMPRCTLHHIDNRSQTVISQSLESIVVAVIGL
jgi:hypothetical protein